MIKGKALAEFGKGDILITPIFLDNGLCVLQNAEPGVIGRYNPPENFTFRDTDTVLTFSNTESLDVLINQLQVLREMMNREDMNDN